ncbi:MAG: hypothetical protein AAB469_01190 [Patescibacteria group bacterium]
MAGTIDFRWDPLELAADATYSTTIKVEITRWWETGAPREVSVSVRQPGEDTSPGRQVLVQRGKAVYPLTGLQPKHHYLVVVTGEDRPVEKFISVPELPRPKRSEEEVFELEQIQFKRAQISSEHRKLVAKEKAPTLDEKKVIALKAKTERVKAEKELDKAKQEEIPEPKKLTPVEKEIVSLKTRVQLIGAQKEFTEAEVQAKLRESKRKIEVLGTNLQAEVLEVFLCRVGKDGNSEAGEIRAFDGSLLSLTMRQGEDFVIAKPDLRDRPRKVMFFLPDDREVKVTVDVPVKLKEKKPSGPSLWKRMKEVYVQERGGRDGR